PAPPVTSRAGTRTSVIASTRDVLADLETPEVDQELEQARSVLKQKEAALEQAIANRAFAQVTATREDALLAESLSAQQNNDQAHAQVHVWEANVHAAKADVTAAQRGFVSSSRSF